jgi:asparagine synthase (glutamine-hydrolysing)
VSGILAILDLAGDPSDAQMAARLLRCPSLQLRGPDGTGLTSDGPVSLGHTLLRTTHESIAESQPLSFDGRVWIVADGRVDARGDLIATLSEERASACSSDGGLLLRAYMRWGERCVDHLIGDFAFAIWDGRSRQLFCARDQMGIKPLYYSRVGRVLVVSSTIESIRRHAGVSNRLNDSAIRSFLLCGYNDEATTTTFYDIQRLAPGHTLTVKDGHITVRRYWTLPIDDISYRVTDAEYTDEIMRLTRVAVADRLRSNSVGVFLSGGIDSPTLAAVASELLPHEPGANPVHGFCLHFRSLLKDPEPAFAEAVARHLQIPIRFYATDRRIGWFPENVSKFPEPTLEILDGTASRQMYCDMAGHSRVAFYGEGPDNALRYEWAVYLRHLIKHGRRARFVRDVAKHVVAHRRVPLLASLPKIIRACLTSKKGDRASSPIVRSAPSVASRQSENLTSHPVKPRAYASLLTAQWQGLFESCEPAYTKVPMEVRHPFLDVRVLQFLLTVPTVPWSRSKHLFREAMRGKLPEKVRRRPKAPLAGDPIQEQILRLGPPPIKSSSALEQFADVSAIDTNTWHKPESMYVAARTAALSHWLEALQE